MTKEQIKEMMKTTGQTLIYEDEKYLEYENPCYGDDIIFEFSDDILIKVFC